MKTLLVTSRVTFIPENYARFVNTVLDCPHISGLLILENRSFGNFFKGLFMWLSRKAPNLGWNLMVNTIKSFCDIRERKAKNLGKNIFRFKTINDPNLIKEVSQFDLVFNARTRFIYKPQILGAPKLGCINIHHGLLPNQRGVFCDLWAKFENRPVGFTLHKMSPKIDDGEIIRVQEVPVDPKENFIDHTLKSSAIEAKVAIDVLNEISKNEKIVGQANTKTSETRYYKNPTSKDLDYFRSRNFVL